MDMSVPAGGSATIVEQPKSPSGNRRNASELDVWLEKAEAMGELKRITAEVDPDLEAAHITYLVTEAAARGRDVIEPTAEGEDAYVREVHSLARLGEKFYMECTPGYYNSEGAPGNRAGFLTDTYGAGPIVFFDKLAAWRAEGKLDGLQLR